MAFDEVSTVLDEVNQRTLPPSVADNLDDPEEDAEADPEDPNLQAQEAHLREVQAAKAAIAKSIEQWHGPAGNSDNLRAQVAGGKISPHDYFTQTGRVYSDDPMAGNLETAQADTSGLDALDNFQYRQANQLGPDPSGRDPFAGALSFSDDSKGPPLPGSIGSALSPGVDALGQTDGHAMAVDTLHFDTRLQTPTVLSVMGPASDGTRNSVSKNNLLGASAWQKNQAGANAALRANFKAAGLPDPSIGAAVLNMPGGGTVVQPGNLGAQQGAPTGPPGIPPGILRNWRPRG